MERDGSPSLSIHSVGALTRFGVQLLLWRKQESKDKFEKTSTNL